jgi:penicillin-binding protein 1A
MNDVEGYAPVYGGTIPASIWHDFMKAALANTPVQNFVTPASIPSSTYTYTNTYNNSYTNTYTTTSH